MSDVTRILQSIEDGDPQAADALDIGQSTAYERWAYAKSRLRLLLGGQASS